MTAVAPTEKDRQRKARARVYRIREGMRNYIHTLGYVAEAYAEGDWKTLGYATWDEYLAQEFGSDQVKLPPEQRQKALRELRLEDMPNRALAAAMNVDEKTIRRDRAAANAAVIDGEVVDPPARSPLVEAMTGAIEDAAERAQDHRSTPGEADVSVPSAAGAGPAMPAPAQERTDEGGASWERADPDHRLAGDEAGIAVLAEADGRSTADTVPSADPESAPTSTGSGSPNLPAIAGEESGPVPPPAGPDPIDDPDPTVCWSCGAPLPQ